MSPAGREITKILLRTLIYFVLVVAILLCWQGSGLFIYEGF